MTGRQVHFVRVIGGLCEMCKRNARTIVPGVTVGAVQPHGSPSLTRIIGLRVGRSSTQLSAAEATRVAGELLAAVDELRDVERQAEREVARAAASLAAWRTGHSRRVVLCPRCGGRLTADVKGAWCEACRYVTPGVPS